MSGVREAGGQSRRWIRMLHVKREMSDVEVYSSIETCSAVEVNRSVRTTVWRRK